ncbi:MAG: Hsp70 family protein [Ferruginibacter sp.]
MKSVNIGIDLGTTNSLVAKFENGKVRVYKNPLGQKETLASVVAFRKDRILVGDKAREYLTKDPVNVFGSFKRKMGTDEKYYVVNMDENITPIELSTYVLKELKNFITENTEPEACVITIPASFDSMQSNATIKAGYAAGFREVFLLQEPIAASLAFFNTSASLQEDSSGNWLVYDLGGGTFDVALVRSTENELKVADHEGNNFLGGLNFDSAIIDHIVIPHIIEQTGIADFAEELKVKFGRYEKLYHKIQYYAEEAKKEVASSGSDTYIEFSEELDEMEYDFSIPVTKEKVKELFEPIIDETIHLLGNILERNNLQSADIREIILVGGSTYLPQVRSRLAEETGIAVNYSIDPVTSIAVGAAYYASNKNYKPAVQEQEEEALQANAEEILASVDFEPTDFDMQVSYNRSSKDKEEVLLMGMKGVFENKYYRIIRADGGFDTGLIKMRLKVTEFLPLISSVANVFTIHVYDEEKNEIKKLAKEISIAQGIFSIDGQPLPHDICIEVDDVENKTTRLEVIFERNSLLPQKRTLYRVISKTIKKGSPESIVINILEGDSASRPSSNLTIGCIEISGKDLKMDLVKGSDIEIQLHINESRILSTNVFLVMTQQEFENVFSLSEKQVNLGRLREQYNILEAELVQTIRNFQYNDDKVWEIQANAYLQELEQIKEPLFKLKEKDKSDDRYVFAEKIARISRETDKLGGNERIAMLLEEYMAVKEKVAIVIANADFEKDTLGKRYQKIEQSEPAFIKSKNASVIEAKIGQLNDLWWLALSNTTSFLIERFIEYKGYEESDFKDYRAAKSIMKMGDNSLEKENYPEFRRHVYSISNLLHKVNIQINQDFKGTGIG